MKPTDKQWSAFRHAMLLVLEDIGPELVSRYRARGKITEASIAASLGDAILTHGPRDPRVYVGCSEVKTWFEAQPAKFQREVADVLAKQWVELKEFKEFNR